MNQRMMAVLFCAVGFQMFTAAAAVPAFTQQPAATRTGAMVKISFAVSAPTDVAVFVEDTQGKVVRHLAAGVLGKNAPAPLTPNALAQSLEWDGKADWGKPAGNGPFKVRVALGLGAKYDKPVISDPMILGDLQNMAAGPDGTLYAVVGGPKIANFDTQRLVALNRDGSYQRTLIPPPSNATREQLEALGCVPVEVSGRTVPVVTNIQTRQTTAFRSVGDAVVTPGGQLLFQHFDEFTAYGAPRIGLVDLTGEKAPPPLLGQPLLPSAPKAGFNSSQRSYLAVSGDGKYAYVSGMAERRQVSTDQPRQWSAVYRVKLPERTGAEVFFGKPDETGKDTAHLAGSAQGMAVDGKGNLLICDAGNNRVLVVSEKDGKFVASFPAESPEFIAVDAHSGAVYILKTTKGADLIKLSGWKDPKTLASIHIPSPRSWTSWRFSADTSATPAVIWVGNEVQLLRLEDQGSSFSEPKVIGHEDIRDFVSLTVDHYHAEPEVYIRKSANGGWVRFNEKTGSTDKVDAVELYNSSGAGLEVGPDGNLFIQRWPFYLFKCDRTGKALKWTEPFTYPEGITPYGAKLPGENAVYDHVCMNYMPHTLGIRPDGHLFVFESPKLERGPKSLVEILPSGKRAGGNPLIWEASDSVVGPRFDQEGNIYIADIVRPLDQLVPPEFTGVTGPLTVKSQWTTQNPKAEIGTIYGSIIKFSPKGGMIAYNGAKPLPYEGSPHLDPSLKTVDGAFCFGGKDWRSMDTLKVTGAQWIHFGMSHVDRLYCNCENARFDVDPFGRVWYPDLGRYRVCVLDTGGNVITTFGGYGNGDSSGPDSPVVDPKTHRVRARATGDAADLKSPFADPEIAFSWLLGVGATDKFIYMGDSGNRRLLRAKLLYAAEATCEVK